MTSPTLVYRELTVNFARSVTANKTPHVVQVVLTPLSTASSVLAGAVFVQDPVAREVILGNAVNQVVFRLVPSDLPGLSGRVLYRIAWRTGGATGRTFTYDFAMPDADVTFEQLNGLNYIIGGAAYLQQSDLGVAGRVARLNDAGQVVDASGTPVAGVANITAVENSLAAERVERQAEDSQIRTQFTVALDEQVNQVITTTGNVTNSLRNDLTNQISAEIQDRLTGDQNLTTALTNKADLVSGKIPLTQIPDEARTQGVQIANQAAMLALTTAQVQQFDFAIRPDGVWALLGTDPSQLAHWSKLNKVSSVNGRDGDVVLTLADLSGTITQSQVTGLTTSLSSKANTTDLTAATTRISAIENDTTIVKKVGGFIPYTLNDTRMAYLDATGQFITKKDGTIISGAGGAVASVNTKVGNVVLTLDDVSAAGGDITQAQVSGLATALNGKVDTSDARLTNARTPTTHAASHASGGSDPLVLATTQVTGLATTLSNYNTRLGSLETRVTDIEINGTGTGGGTGSSGRFTWFSALAPTGNFSLIDLQSPFGYNPLNAFSNAQGYYYNPAGADANEVRFPYITPNGHLELRRWDESGPADPVLATQNDLLALGVVVNGKANSSTVNSLITTVDTKASQATVDSLTATVNTRASQAALDSLDLVVSGKATITALNLKASASDLLSLSVTVADHASILNVKADLVGGKVPLAQIPTGIPQASVTNLTTDLAAKAPLVGGKVPVANIPTGIPQASITNLTTNLASKADLGADGKLLTTQIPALSLTSVTTVTARSAMLALTSSQVQPGDICIITATADQGSYILTATDPSVFANWKLLVTPLDSVLSVNGQTGTVTLTAASIGALASNASIPQTQVTGLSTTFAGKVSTTTYDAAIATRPTWSVASNQTLETILDRATPGKQRVNYVATAQVLSLSGTQSVDGIVAPVGSKVLLTAQSSSVLHGIWQVNSGAWTRVTDMASGSYLVKGTMVVVSSGTTNANTLWQVTSNSGVVDTANNNWTKIGNVGASYSATQGNGIEVTGSGATQTISVKPVPSDTVGTGTTADPYVQRSSGISVTAAGVGVDETLVARKYIGSVPSGSTTPRIYHNLGTRRVLVQVQEAVSGIGVLVGWQASANNYVDLEFSSPPNSGQWAVIVIG